MGAKVPLDDLERRAREFFEKVIWTLLERNKVRGDSYLEMDVEDFVAMFRDKAGRIKTAAPLSDETGAVRKEIDDSVIDEAGYAALLWIWLEENRSVSGN